MVYYEDFSLMDAISATCILPAQHEDKYACAWYDEAIQKHVFTDFVNTCEVKENLYDIPPYDNVFSS